MNPKQWNKIISKFKNTGQQDRYYIQNCHTPIVSQESFDKVQAEKKQRTNIELNRKDIPERDSKKYKSKKPLSGMLICGECGRTYRRITRNSGEIVFRCANSVEHRSRICKESPMVTSNFVKRYIAYLFFA